ncbi:MAG: hypothetical protein CL398_09805 [Acidiferrobacteraceae bacterium]|nr:hypothetical protein [Acidiferrobacteraceae bacterium]
MIIQISYPSEITCKKILVTIVALFTMFVHVSRAVANNETANSVYGLLQIKWRLIGSIAYEQVLPGLPPYGHLERVVSIKNYLLQRGSQEIFCQISYDSQADHEKQQCSKQYFVPSLSMIWPSTVWLNDQIKIYD